MLDINLFREDKGGNPQLIKESQKKRGKSVDLVDEIISLDRAWIKARFNLDETNKRVNELKKLSGEKAKAKQRDLELEAELKALKDSQKGLEAEEQELKIQLDRKLGTIGNLVHESVVVSMNEDDNDVVRTWPGALHKETGLPTLPGLLTHDKLLTLIDGVDYERGASVAGHRGYFLKGKAWRLKEALIRYGCDFLESRGFEIMETPPIMNREPMAKTAQLEDFQEQLYKVTGHADTQEQYLIATSEQPLSAFHMNEWLEPQELPQFFAGVSPCHRTEAGAHGRDVAGILRTHVFHKVEQFVYCKPEESWQIFEQLINNSENFYQSLNVSYRVVGIVSGALNNAAAKKYDLEAWFPASGRYRELVSCSNCTDYQSRNLEIRYGAKAMGDREKKYVHLLNSTLTAAQRTLCCILENYQTPNGITVPEVLRKYMDGADFIPFVDKSKSNKANGKSGSVEGLEEKMAQLNSNKN